MSEPNVNLTAAALECVRDGRTLFSELSIVVAAGELLMLEGANGSGKTSLLRILSGIRTPDSGKITWCGKDIYELGPEYHEYVAYVGHKDGIKQDLTPAENLHIAQSMGNPNESRSIDEALDHFHLRRLEDVPARNLSAGQQRRLALGRLLVTDSTLWLLDEPFTSLDKAGVGVFETLMHDHVAAGGMIVMTTHHKVRVENARRLDLSA